MKERTVGVEIQVNCKAIEKTDMLNCGKKRTYGLKTRTGGYWGHSNTDQLEASAGSAPHQGSTYTTLEWASFTRMLC